MECRYAKAWLLSVLMILGMAFPFSSIAQEDAPEYEEISILLNVQDFAYYDLDAIFLEDKVLLSTISLFQVLKIYINSNAGYDSVYGYISDEKNAFLIDYNLKLIRYGGKEFPLTKEEIIINDYGLFLQTAVLGKVFGLSGTFDFRSLTFLLNPEIELPIIRMLKVEKMRENLKQLQGEVKADTLFSKRWRWAGGAALDYNASVISNQGEKTTVQGNAGLGAILLGGELNLRSSFNTSSKYTMDQLSYRWHLVNNESRFIRQVYAGQISPTLFTSENNVKVGLGVTNAGTTYKRQFGFYELEDFTEPGWDVELYINNVLVDFSKADASGRFNFKIPLVYGASKIKLKMYGPWGEEREKEEVINIPYSFVPVGKVEYQVFSGIANYNPDWVFSQARINYGLFRQMTVGAGYEYYANSESNQSIPFASVSGIVKNTLMLNFSYLDKVRSKASLSARLPSNFYFETDFALYRQGQKSIATANLLEANAAFSIPYRLMKARGFAKFSVRHGETPITKTTFAESNISFILRRFSANLSAMSNFSSYRKTALVSGGFSYNIKRWFTVFGQGAYNATEATFSNARIEIQKKINSRFFLAFSADYSFIDKQSSAYASVYISLGAVRSSVATSYSKKTMSVSTGISGALLWASSRPLISASSRGMSGRGAIDVIPFLDINHNGQKDREEPIVKGLNVNINKGSRMGNLDNDSIIRFVSLEPYTNYLLTIQNSGLENISWTPAFNSAAVFVEPNIVKKVLVPVRPMGEVNGTLTLLSGSRSQGLSKVKLIVLDSLGRKVASFYTEDGGEFVFMGLSPGNYQLTVDPEVLNKKAWVLASSNPNFTLKATKEGDIAESIQLVLKPK